MEEEKGRVPYVQRIPTERGLKLYFRKGSVRRPLNSADGSDALRAEVNAILVELAQVERAQKPVAGTVGGLIRAYNRSAEFLGLARSTQADYQRMLDEIEQDIGRVLLQDVTTAFIADLKNAWAPRGHRAANLRLQMLINAFGPAITDGRISSDPFHRLKKVKAPHDSDEPNAIWEDAEVEAVIACALQRKMPGLARAIALGRWAGFRRGTICAIPLNARTTGYAETGGTYRRLHWLTEKRRVLCDKPEDPRLTTLLDRTPNRALTIAYNRRNGRWQERQLNQAIDRLVASLAKEGSVRPILTLHGLRHSRGVELAEAGASDSEIMSQLEHKTVRAAQIYRRQAERRRLAGAAQKKVDAAVAARRHLGACQN